MLVWEGESKKPIARSVINLQGIQFYLRKHCGPDAEERAAADYNAIAAHRDEIAKVLAGIEGREEKHRWVREYWSRLVNLQAEPEADPEAEAERDPDPEADPEPVDERDTEPDTEPERPAAPPSSLIFTSPSPLTAHSVPVESHSVPVEAHSVAVEGGPAKSRGISKRGDGWQAVMKLQGIKYYFRIHTGPDAEARAAMDYNAMVAHRDEVVQQLDGIWDREMKRRHVKEYLGRLVSAKAHPHSPPSATVLSLAFIYLYTPCA